MPWKEHRAMSSKIEFVERANERGANIAALCREYKISRQTGHKWLKRYQELGYEGLEEASRRPLSCPLGTAEDIVTSIVAARVKYPRWGAKKLAIVLRRTLGESTPSESTIDRVLRRFSLLRHRRKKRSLSIVEKAPQVAAKSPNDVWTIDFKGWWRATNGQRCDPLTVRDGFSRCVLATTMMMRCTTEPVRDVMTRLFRRHGVPRAIQCDNGTPFICMQSPAGLTTLSAWWVSLGIRIVRSRPACPQDNGGHERMHADIAGDLQSSPEASLVRQQRAADRWRQTFNHVRPHEALGGKTPAEVYSSSPAKIRVKPAIYPSHWMLRRVSTNGTIKVAKENYFVTSAVRGFDIALEPLGGIRHRAWFYDVDLGELEVVDLRPRTLALLAA